MLTTRIGRLAPTMVAVLTLASAACAGDGASSDTAATDRPTTGATEPALVPASGTGTADTEPPAADTPTPEPIVTDPAATDPPATDRPTTEPPVTEPPKTDPPATEPPVTEPATTEPVGTTLVNVYWASIVLSPVPGNEERIGAGARTVAADTPVRNSLEALLAGTDAIEADIGMSSLIPVGTRVLGIAIDDTTATVDLSGEFENSIGGTLAESMQIAQVVFTVTQFDGIDRVKFHIDGQPQDALLSHGFEVGDGLTRDDFGNIRPAILVEQPYPGAAVANPLVIAGESNTFEATVQFSVLTGGGDGLVVMDGFTTATAGNGTWGTYEAEVDLTQFPDSYLPGRGAVVVFEVSPADGGPTNIVEIPITLPDL